MLHEMLLLRYGGLAGVRDSAVLDAVVARPRERFAAGAAGLAELAACYAAGIVLNGPFTSGNLACGFLTATPHPASGHLLPQGEGRFALGRHEQLAAFSGGDNDRNHELAWSSFALLASVASRI